MKLSHDAVEHAKLVGYVHLAFHLKNPQFDGGTQYLKTGRSVGRHSGCEFCKSIRGTPRVA